MTGSSPNPASAPASGSTRLKRKKPPPRKAKVHIPPPDAVSSSSPGVPQAMIFRRGQVAASVLQLVSDLRLVFSPHSSQRLQERTDNTMRDFLSVAPQLGVTHFLCLTQSDVGVNLRTIRVPHGPTLTWRVVGYSLMRDVAAAQRRPHSLHRELQHPPLVVLNNFTAARQPASTEGEAPPSSADVSAHLPLLSTLLQHMFPALHLPSLVLSQCRRVVLFHFDPQTQLVDVRHYLITAAPAGVSRVVRRLVKGRQLDMHAYADVSDYVQAMERGEAGGLSSDSEAEVGEDSKVELAERYAGRGNVQGGRSGVRLRELGPRLTLSLLKAEDDFCGGRVLYHHYLSRTPDEVAELKRRKEQRRREREQRRREQEQNVRRKRREEGAEQDGDADSELSGEDAQLLDDDHDDSWYYEKEVGEKPAEAVFGSSDGPRQGRRRGEAEDGEQGSEEDKEAGGQIGKFKKRRIAAAEAKEKEEQEAEGGEDGGSNKRKRSGGRRVGAGPRQPWVRGRGGSHGGRGGSGRGRGRAAGGSKGARGASRG